MQNSKLSRFSAPQLASASATLIGLGLIWVAVVAYRFNARGMSGEWGNYRLRCQWFRLRYSLALLCTEK